MKSEFDIIVVGAGNGGLSAAASLAAKGKKVLVLEQHNLPGGSATSFRRGRFEFESALHELCDVGTEDDPGTVRKLFRSYDIDQDWYLEDHLFHLYIPGQIDVVLPTGKEAFIKEMEKQVPGSSEGVRTLLDLGEMAIEAQAYSQSPTCDPKIMMTKYDDFLRMASSSTTEGMNALGIPKKAQDILNAYWCYLGAVPDELDFMTTALMIYKYVVMHPGIPDGKSHQLSCALADSIIRHGGEIWYNTPVEKILINDGTCKGVRLKDRDILCDHVIANISPSTLMSSMLEKDVPVPEYPLKLANARELAFELETMYLGLNRSADELGIKDYSVLMQSDLDPVLQFEKSDAIRKGSFIVNCLNRVVPHASPEGTCTLFFTTFGDRNFWENVKLEDYFRIKNERMKDWVNYYEKKTGIEISPYIEEAVFATPVTFARYLQTPEGTPYGYQVTKWDNIISRLGAMDNEQIFRNLRLTGAAAENIDGYNLCYLNGNIQAMKTLQDMAKGGNEHAE